MFYLKIKRLFDIIFSLAGIVILSPLMLLTAILIKLESRGPVIYQQRRTGLKGRFFTMYKFRSMCMGAEKGGVYEAKNDARVTGIGRIIRRTSIDELPQFINILKGDMSVIGPRPTLPFHPWTLDKYTDIQRKRFSVRPGVTGWAQVNGRKDVEWNRRIEYDIEYVENISFLFDLKILYKTIIKVLSMQDNINTKKTGDEK